MFKVHGGPQMMAGLPDLVCCIQGMFVGIEVKQPGKMPTPRQEYVARLIRDANGICIVAHSVEEAIEQIDHVFARNTS